MGWNTPPGADRVERGEIIMRCVNSACRFYGEPVAVATETQYGCTDIVKERDGECSACHWALLDEDEWKAHLRNQEMGTTADS